MGYMSFEPRHLRQFGYRAALCLSILICCLAVVFIQRASNNTAKADSPKVAIARVWHGRTPAAKAEEYLQYLTDSGIKKMEALPGNLGCQIFRRTENGVTEFTVISYWESRESIKQWAGAEIEKTRYLDKDKEYLLELEPTVKHFEVVLNDWKK